MSGSLVRMCSSTRMPPRSPMARPADLASAVSGRTPSARITMSAGYALPDFVRTSSAPPSCCTNPATASPSASRMPCRLTWPSTRRANSRSSGASTWSSISTSVTSNPRVDQVLRRLQPDEAAADHHRAPRRLHELDPGVVVHPGEERCAALDPLADRPHVRHRPHLEDAGQVDPGQRRAHRGRSRREHQLVVRFDRHLAGRDIAQLHSLALRRDRRSPRNSSWSSMP